MNPVIVELWHGLTGFMFLSQVFSHVTDGTNDGENPPHTHTNSGLFADRRVVTESLHNPSDHSSPEIPKHSKYNNLLILFASLMNLNQLWN